MKKTTQKLLAVLLSVLMVLTNGIIYANRNPGRAYQGTYVTAEAAEDQDTEVLPDAAEETVAEQAAEEQPQENEPAIEQAGPETAPEETSQQAADEEKTFQDVKEDDRETEILKEEQVVKSADAVPEKDADDKDEKPEEEKMPAFHASASTGSGITVSVSAPEGVFPEGTTLRVSDASASYAMNVYDNILADDRKVADAKAVDITFYNKDGIEIEPENNSVHVSISLASAVEGDSFAVLHQTDGGSIETVTNNASGNGASFLADSFSVYVIIGTEPTEETKVARVTYEFYNGTEIVDTQIIKNSDSESDILKEPQVPERDNYRFVGWSTNPEATEPDFVFGKQDISAYTKNYTEDATVAVYAIFVEAPKYHVYYMNGVGAEAKAAAVIPREEGVTLNPMDIKLPLDSTHAVVGWYKETTLQTKVDAVPYEAADLTLYPRIEEGHYIYFESGEEATYVKPEFVAATDTARKPEDPNRPGWTFDGWYDGDTEYSFGGPVTSDVTLTAKWKAGTAAYTVIYWRQKVTDDKNAADSEKQYDYADSKQITVTTGTEITSQSAEQQTYKYFHLNTAKAESIIVKGDGTSILNVYYDRDLLTIVFENGKRSLEEVSNPSINKSYIGIVNGEEVHVTYNYSGWGYGRPRKSYTGPLYKAVFEDLVFTGLYEQNLGMYGYEWPYHEAYKWLNHNDLNNNDEYVALLFLDCFKFDEFNSVGIDNTINLTEKKQDVGYTVEHFKQNIDGESYPDTPANKAGLSRGGTFLFSNKYEGFTVAAYRKKTNGKWEEWTPTDSNGSAGGGDIQVRYARKHYKLEFYDYNKVVREEDVIYEGSLSAYGDYVPERPEGIPEDFTFEGWYKDAPCTIPFDFSTEKMMNNVEVFAKWQEPEYDAIVHMDMAGGSADTSYTVQVKYGDKITSDLLPKVIDADGSVVFDGNGAYGTIQLAADDAWCGWATLNGEVYTLFNFDEKIYDNIVLYPFHLSDKSYTFKYDANGGSGTVTDENEYTEIAKPVVKSASGLTPPNDSNGNPKVFLGWATSKDGAVSYYPGQTILLDKGYFSPGEVVLYAVWGDTQTNTTVTYHSNYPSGEDKTVQREESIANNHTIVLDTIAALQFEDENAVFLGWATEANGPVRFRAGQTVGVDNNGNIADTTNDLYAIWEEKKHVTVIITGETYDKEYDGEEHAVSFTLSADDAAYDLSHVQYKGTSYEPGRMASVKGKDVTVTAKELGLNINDFQNDDPRYAVEFVLKNDAKLNIKPRVLTIETKGDTRAYNGVALTKKDGWEVKGIVDGETYYFEPTGHRKDVGSSDNTYVITWQEEGNAYTAKESNYVIPAENVTLGELVVTKAPLTVVTEGESREYNGEALRKPGTVSGFVNGEYAPIETSVSVKDVEDGKKQNTYRILWDAADATAKASNYEVIEETIGELEILKKKLTLTSDDGTKEYDGKPLTKHVMKSEDGWVAGEGAEYKFSGSQTQVGWSENKFDIEKPKDGTKLSNYEVEKKYGKLTVTDRQEKYQITLVANKDEVIYDGREHEVKGLEKTVFEIEGVTYTVSGYKTSDPKETDAGTYPNKVDIASVVVKDPDGNDVTKQFRVIPEDGNLIIKKAKVTLLSASGTHPYDGKPFELHEMKLKDGFVGNDDVEITFTGSRTDVGKEEGNNTYTYKAKGNTNLDNYDIDPQYGTLEVVKNSEEIIIKADGGRREYDGTALKVDTWTSENLPDGFEFKNVRTKGEITDVGTTDNIIESYEIIDTKNNQKDVTDWFTGVKKEEGTLEVTKRKVVISSEGATKPYDGTPLTNKNWAYVEGSFVSGEVLEKDIKTTGIIVAVGETNNTVYVPKTEKYKESNYDLSGWQLGKLVITPNTTVIQVTAPSDSKMYDGTPLEAEKLLDKVIVTGLPEGFTYDVEVSGSITNVKENAKDNSKITGFVIRKEGVDVTNQFTGIAEPKPGTLEITPRKVTITAATDDKTYDGTPLINSNYEISGDGFVGNEKDSLDITVKGEQTDAGSSPNEVSYTIKDMPRILSLVSGTSFDADNYTIEPKNGTLTVHKRELKLVSWDLAKEYDGEPLTNDYWKKIGKESELAEKTGFVEGEDADFDFTGKQVGIGESSNIFTVTAKSGTKLENYDYTPTFGKLKITAPAQKYKIEAIAKSDEQTYNGKTWGVSGFKQKTATINGNTFTVENITTSDPEGIDADTYPNSIQEIGDGAKVIGPNGEDVTGIFDITLTPGNLTIKPAKVHLKSWDLEKEYDGEPLTNAYWEKAGKNAELEVESGFAEGEGADYTFTESVTGVESKTNKFTYTLNENTKASNYEEIKPEFGTLTVVNRDVPYEITVETEDAEFTYDGTEKTINDFEKVFKTLEFEVDDHTYTVSGLTANVSATDVKTDGYNKIIGYEINVEGTAVVTNETGDNVASSFKVHVKPGTLTIKPRQVTLTSESDSKQYDGTPLTRPEVTVSGDGFVDGEVTDIRATGRALYTSDGKVPNTIEWTETQAFKDSNYNIAKDEGELSITINEETQILVKAGSANMMYNGNARTNKAFTVEGLPNGLSAEVETSGSVTNVREGRVNNTIASVVIRDAAGVDVTKQFASITRESGVLSLYPRTVKLTSRSASKVYDGTPLTAPEVTVSGDGFVVGEVTNIRATGSISQVGSAANAIAYTTGRSYDSRNYNITTEEGTLVITRTNSEIVVTSGSASKVYDGTPLIATGVTAILPEGFEGYTVTALVTGIATNVSEGTVANTLTDIRIHDPNGNDVTDQFEENAWTIIEGTLNITPRTVIMTSGSATKVFDATPLTSYQITESGDGFVAGEGVNYNVTGTQTLVGTGTNTFAYAARPGTDLRNYVITQIEGILTVTAAAPVPVPPGPVPPAPIPPAPIPPAPVPPAPVPPAPVPPAAPIVPAPVYTPTEPEVVRVTPETPAPTPTPEIVQAEDVETPLADIPKKKDNALPFLLLTAAWIILMIFAGRMKKQQKKVFEMTEELNDKQMDAEIRNGSQSAGTKK